MEVTWTEPVTPSSLAFMEHAKKWGELVHVNKQHGVTIVIYHHGINRQKIAGARGRKRMIARTKAGVKVHQNCFPVAVGQISKPDRDGMVTMETTFVSHTGG